MATLYKCMCKTGGWYLPAFALWRSLDERLQQCASHFTTEEKVQQRVCIDLCFRPGKTGAEMYEMLQAAFRESCLSRLKTFEWYSHCKSGRRSFEDDPHPGRPFTSHTEETVAAHVREIIRADRRLTIRDVAEEVRIAFSMCQRILREDMRMRRVTTKFVPYLLTAEQKDNRVSICTDLQDRAQNDPNFMSSVITGDECWVYGYDLETKQMSSQWSTSSSSSSPRPKKARQVKSHIKTMLMRSLTLTGWFIMNLSLQDRR